MGAAQIMCTSMVILVCISVVVPLYMTVGEVRPHKINKCNKLTEYMYYSIILQHIINAATNAAERFRYLTAP